MAVYLRAESGTHDVTEIVLNHALRMWKEYLWKGDIHLLPYDTVDLTAHIKMRDMPWVDEDPGGPTRDPG